jgi:hypothetical protein
MAKKVIVSKKKIIIPKKKVVAIKIAVKPLGVPAIGNPDIPVMPVKGNSTMAARMAKLRSAKKKKK